MDRWFKVDDLLFPGTDGVFLLVGEIFPDAGHWWVRLKAGLTVHMACLEDVEEYFLPY